MVKVETERTIQRRIVNGLRKAGYVVWHIPNGGSRHTQEAGNLKRDGVMAGVPDLWVLARDGRSWWLEVKRPGGKLSDAQRYQHKVLSDRGQRVALVTSLDEAIEVIEGVR